MIWFKRLLASLLLVLIIATTLPFFITLNDYIPQIEKIIFEKFKEPVSIKSISLTLLPRPRVTLNGIKFGSTDDITSDKVILTPRLFSLLQPSIVISSIEIDSLVLTQKVIKKIPEWINADTSSSKHQPTKVRVENIDFNNALVKFDNISFGPLNANIKLDTNGSPKEALINTLDGKLNVLIKPDNSAYLINVSAKEWALPVGPQIVFDELKINGKVTQNNANLTDVSAKLFGGTVKGKAMISWEKGLEFKSNLDIRQVEMQNIVLLLTPKTHISGKLSANPVFSASATTADKLMDALLLETPFNIQNGVLFGVDIQKAATGLIKQGGSGGETRFDQFSGRLVIEHGSYHFTQLKIASGTLAVDGNVNVSPKKALTGRINAQITAVGVSANVPLNVTGSLDAPVLFPTRGAMAGAAVGTVIMGPGFGTSVGTKVGGWVENLFGKKDEPPKK